MRPFLLFILFSLSFLAANANTIVGGYLVTLKNDTIKCKIRVDDLDLYSSVTIFDTAGIKTIYKAEHKEILGFGFTYKDQPYDYLLKADDDSTWLFRIRKLQGPPYNLYYFFDFRTNDHNRRSTLAGSYMIEDTANRVVTWNGVFTDNFKKRMREFLHNDQHLIDLYNKKVDHLRDIPAFVKAVNEPGR
jgi:hypothetical protein